MQKSRIEICHQMCHKPLHTLWAMQISLAKLYWLSLNKSFANRFGYPVYKETVKNSNNFGQYINYYILNQMQKGRNGKLDENRNYRHVMGLIDI